MAAGGFAAGGSGGKRRVAPGLVVRRATARDVAALSLLVLACFEHYRLPAPRPRVVSERVRRALNRSPGFRALLAEVDGRPVGYLAFVPSCIICIETYEVARIIQVNEVFVAKEWRGRGAGAALFARVRAEARRTGASQVAWEALRANRRARRFYGRLGATEHQGQMLLTWEVKG